jgi:hypothetical protein
MKHDLKRRKVGCGFFEVKLSGEGAAGTEACPTKTGYCSVGVEACPTLTGSPLGFEMGMTVSGVAKAIIMGRGRESR